MADEKYWSYQASTKTPCYSDLPERCFNGTEKEWFSLSPGMRREIVMQFDKNKLK